jgi:Domain of unknown function (DUF4389)
MEEPGDQYPPTPAASPTPAESPPPAGESPAYAPSPPYPPESPYPLTFNVDYPDRPLNRLTTGLRFLWIIPIGVIASLLTSGNISVQGTDYSWSWATAGILFLPLLLMILFRKKYPRWWFDWNLNLSRFIMRVVSYAQLLRDEYPSTDEEQAVHLDFVYPDASRLSRGLPIVKWFLAIPHWVVLAFLWIAVFVCVVIAWFAILFTGSYPPSLFEYVVGINRWTLRVVAYSLLLTTDRYPPFSWSE